MHAMYLDAQSHSHELLLLLSLKGQALDQIPVLALLSNFNSDDITDRCLYMLQKVLLHPMLSDKAKPASHAF